MDDWHRKLAHNLVATTPAGSLPDGAASLEIAFGRARSVVTYALELARAHRIPATGNVAGDRIWLSLGGDRVSVTMNRREGRIVVVRPRAPDEVPLRWDDTLQGLVAGAALPAGETANLETLAASAVDLEALAREAIDAIVGNWRARPPSTRPPHGVPPPDFEDEPTKG